VGILAGLVAFWSGGADDLFGELAGGLADELMLCGEFKIHCDNHPGTRIGQGLSGCKPERPLQN
jgi:hypothetical protein